MEEKDFIMTEACLTICVPKELDHFQAEQIRRISDQKLREQNIRNIIFDFRKTKFMDSSGIGVLIGRYKKMHYQGGMVTAVHVNKKLEKLFQMSGVTKVIEMIEEAGGQYE